MQSSGSMRGIVLGKKKKSCKWGPRAGRKDAPLGSLAREGRGEVVTSFLGEKWTIIECMYKETRLEIEQRVEI